MKVGNLRRLTISNHRGVPNLFPEDNDRKTENDGENCPQYPVDETGHFLVAFHHFAGHNLADHPQPSERN
jgi:hypothetical protein